MSSASQNAVHAVCPRCRSTPIKVLSTSPAAGVWTIFSCTICLYAWRSTEPEENMNPDKYPAVFRLQPESLEDLLTAPTVPPLRSRSKTGSST
jgi:hypothetical protein